MKYFSGSKSRSLGGYKGSNLGYLNGKSLEVERAYIQLALRATWGNRKKVADMLKISYKYLLNKIMAYHLFRPVNDLGS